MTAEFDQLVAEFEEFQSRIHSVDDRFAHLAGMQDDLAALEVVAHSPDRSVTVVAGPGGSVRDIRVTEDACQLGAQRLSSTLMSTLREAIADAARQQAGIVQEYVGGAAPVLDQVLETQSAVTGVPVEELREKVPRPVEEEPTVFRETAPPPADPAPETAADSFLRNLSDDEED